MYKLSESKQEKLQQETSFSYSRSSGPGGQKVNKTETRVELFWNIADSTLFTENQKALLQEKLKHRLNSKGEVHFYSDQFRSRPQNQKACVRNLVSAIEKGLTRPKPRRPTKPTKSSVEKRIHEKKRLGDKKKWRQKPD